MKTERWSESQRKRERKPQEARTRGEAEREPQEEGGDAVRAEEDRRGGGRVRGRERGRRKGRGSSEKGGGRAPGRERGRDKGRGHPQRRSESPRKREGTLQGTRKLGEGGEES
jgi:hypothetical protein